MPETAHLEELRRKHANLAIEIESEERHPGASDLRIQELKRQKLKLKDEIARLSHG
ncbi:MAG: YdcH family protein [Pseudomonadota bacterium]